MTKDQSLLGIVQTLRSMAYSGHTLAEIFKVADAAVSAHLEKESEEESEEKHWFAYSFTHHTNSSTTTGCVYLGYGDKLVTVLRIEEAKLAAKMSKDSALSSVSYMGYATRDDIENLH